MPRKSRWWYVLQDSKNEVRLAVDLYNRSGMERQLEAFIVHMSMGWLKLLQAHFEKTGLDIFIRDERGWRIRHAFATHPHTPPHRWIRAKYGLNTLPEGAVELSEDAVAQLSKIDSATTTVTMSIRLANLVRRLLHRRL